jgi:hypothetical protein
MGAEYPSLKQAGDSVYAWHGDMCRITRRRQHDFLTGVSIIRQVIVATPAIGEYHCAGDHSITDEWQQIYT